MMYKALGEQNAELVEVIKIFNFQCRKLSETYNADLVGNAFMCFAAYLLAQAADTEEEIEASIKIVRANSIENFNKFKKNESQSKKTD